MSDLTDVKFFLASLIRPIVREAIREEIHLLSAKQTPSLEVDPYGNFKWLQAICADVPESTLRIKSARGEIPGVIKFGKRVLYDKEVVLNWLKSQTRQSAMSTTELEQAAEEQISHQLAKKGG